MTQRIVLTGGTGLIGAAIRQRLQKGGYEVILLSRQHISDAKCCVISGDLSDEPNKFLQKLPKFDVLVHCAAHIAGDPSLDLEKLARINILSTERLFAHCAKETVKRVIYISSYSFLEKPLRAVIEEGHPVAPLSAYGLSKYWGELCLLSYGGAFRPYALRVSSPLALDLTLLQETVVKKWITQARAGEPLTIFGTGSRTQDFVWVEDIASSVVNLLIHQGEGGVFNIASGSSVSMGRIAELIFERFPSSAINYGPPDSNEMDRWNISIEKARAAFSYRPSYSSEELISALLDSIF